MSQHFTELNLFSKKVISSCSILMGKLEEDKRREHLILPRARCFCPRLKYFSYHNLAVGLMANLQIEF
jgi:hypothetical protein